MLSTQTLRQTKTKKKFNIENKILPIQLIAFLFPFQFSHIFFSPFEMRSRLPFIQSFQFKSMTLILCSSSLLVPIKIAYRLVGFTHFNKPTANALQMFICCRMIHSKCRQRKKTKSPRRRKSEREMNSSCLF